MNLRFHLVRLWREPSIIVAEIAWRWAFTFSMVSFLLFAFFRLQRAIRVLPEQEEMLLSRNPLQIAEALLQLWQAARPLVLQLGAILVPATILLWMIAITVGRAYVINRVWRQYSTPNWISLIVLNGLRALGLLLLVLAYVACSRATVLVSTPQNPNYLLALLVFLGLFATAVAVWSAVNWLLSVATIFSATGAAVVESFRQTLRLQKEAGMTLARISTQNAGVRAVVALVLTVVALFPLAFYRATLLFWTLELMLFLFYCAVSDLLLLARLSEYIEVIEARSRALTATT